MISLTTSIPLASDAFNLIMRQDSYLEYHHIVVLAVHHLGACHDRARLSGSWRSVEQEVWQTLLLDVLFD